ncbi:PQQ-dependent sugar dehydrogenase [Endozoicomonas sp. G2_2]|nr:PQQ-dependent sugar dehydrogenase [Endozoicomonas sp. G2_2]
MMIKPNRNRSHALLFGSLIAAAGLATAADTSPSNARAGIAEEDGQNPSNVPAQLDDPTTADVTVTGHVFKPRPVAPNAANRASLSVPDGLSVDVFAKDLGNARMMATGPDGAIYVTRRKEGDVLMLVDRDDDGRADDRKVVAKKDAMHGIEIDGNTAWLMTVNDVYRTTIQDDGSFGELEKIATGFPSGGQHPNRTLALGPDDALYVSVGSTCNACDETEKLSATMVRMSRDGSEREIFASGLRNTIGFDFEPQTGELYGFDHGIDWLGDDEQPEEFNHLQQGKQYGWPYVYADSQLNPQDVPPEGTNKQWAEQSVEPMLMWTPHAAPMQMRFYESDALGTMYRGDAFVAMRGSWNRKPPSGYEIVRVDFDEGEPQSIEPFITGFVQQTDDGWQQIGRLAGLTVAEDGSLLFSDDENGVIYRVSRDD